MIKDFFERFFTPRGIRKSKDMNILVCILIFLVEVLLLFIPVNSKLTNDVENYTKNNKYTNVFYNTKGDISDEVKTSNIILENNELVSDQVLGIIVSDYNVEIDNIKYTVSVVFDIKGQVSHYTSQIENAYKVKYPNDGNTKISCASLLIYIDSYKGKTQDELIDEYHNMAYDDVIKAMDKATYVNIYRLSNENNYVMLFEKNKVYIEFIDEDGSLFTDSLTYSQLESIQGLSLNNQNNIEYLSQKIALEFGKVYAKNQGFMYLGNALMYALIFPLLLAFILYIGLHKRSNIIRFREYYAIITTISIFPCLLSFMLAWFILQTSGMIYLAILTIMSLGMVYSMVGLKD